MDRSSVVWGPAVGGHWEHNMHHPESIFEVVQVNAELAQNTIFCFYATNMKFQSVLTRQQMKNLICIFPSGKSKLFLCRSLPVEELHFNIKFLMNSTYKQMTGLQ